MNSLLLSILIFLFTDSVTVSDRVLFEEYHYSGISLDISKETKNARANHWHPDGTEIYVTGRYTENVASYKLSDPWNLSTATFSGEFDLSNEFGSTKQQSNAHGLYIRADGEKMWLFNRTEIWGYTLSNPWELSSAQSTYYANLDDFVHRGHDIDFKPDGMRLFIDDRNAQAVHEVNLSKPWDITTIKSTFTLDISDQENEVRGIEIIADGTIMLLMDTGRKEILQYHLSEPYELKSAQYIDAFDVSGQSGNPRGLSIRPDLQYFYVTGNDNQAIYQYSRHTLE